MFFIITFGNSFSQKLEKGDVMISLTHPTVFSSPMVYSPNLSVEYSCLQAWTGMFTIGVQYRHIINNAFDEISYIPAIKPAFYVYLEDYGLPTTSAFVSAELGVHHNNTLSTNNFHSGFFVGALYSSGPLGFILSCGYGYPSLVGNIGLSIKF